MSAIKTIKFIDTTNLWMNWRKVVIYLYTDEIVDDKDNEEKNREEKAWLVIN